ncbi:MAG: gliding motility-associated C-terminal domain-containing protein [Bacteroidales bacterium]|nr:gliding motility-associated C-terminal domain-containing protein [Bacteroidales bacterium]
MRRHAHRIILTLLLLAVAQQGMSQTNYTLRNHDTLHIQNCHGDHVHIEHPNDYVTQPFDATVTLETNGVPFDVVVGLQQSNTTSFGTLRIWDGDSTSGTLLVDTTCSTLFLPVHSSSGYLTARLQREDSSMMSLSYAIEWGNNATFHSTCINDVQNLRVTRLSSSSATLHWVSTTPYIQVSYGNTTQTISGDSIRLNNLTPDTRYTVTLTPLADTSRPCCARTISFLTDCLPLLGCPDVTDLHSNSVRGYYGTFDHPYDSVGLIDYPPDVSDNGFLCRHTVHTDTTETDPRTGNLLRTVCPGTQASVRLGNWNIHREAEALEYYLYIDTNIYAILLLHYAVVLQNPGHSASQQPHFRMEVLDPDGELIDPVCGAADFSASSSLGWNSYGPEELVWKDWTTEGFDMTPYHGQAVKVRFTTKDCSEGMHYGYAYFSAECRLNRAVTEYCGESDTNSITAPDGFNYLWYYDINHPVSTEQTIHFTNNDSLLHCRLISITNPSCYVTLNTYAGHRWPHAIVDTLLTQSLGCDGYQVQFLNRSVVTNDNGDTVEHHCESARWYFGDAYLSFDYSPQHIYRDSGDYTVTLIAGIANNSCTDTTTFTLHIPDFYVPALKDTAACDTFWIDGVAYTTEGLGPSRRVRHPDDCDTLYTLNLHVLHSPLHEFPPDTFCYSASYTWLDQTVGSNSNLTRSVSHHLRSVLGTAANGCDSLVAITLLQLAPDVIALDRETDCANNRYTLSAHSPLPYLYWQASPHDTCLDGHEHDSTVTVSPQRYTVYTVTTDHRDTLYCPTSSAVALQALTFPEGSFSVHPEMLTYDHPEFDAHVGGHTNGQQWSLLFYPDGTDTIALAETSAHLHYRLDDYSIDSLRVILAVNNDNCIDTVYRTLPFARIALWSPTVFTPTEDANNRFAPVATGVLEAELRLYDRAGRLVFTTRDLAAGWDGTRDGHPCPQGAYVWLLRYRTVDYPTIWRTTSGTVTLVR